MKKFLVLVILLAFGNLSVYAKDNIIYHNINEALNSDFAKKMLKGNVEFQFSQKYKIDNEPLVLSKSSNKFRSEYDSETSQFTLIDKDYKTACQYVFIATLKEFEKHAQHQGSSKVVNLQGFFKEQNFDSKDKFQCAVGKMITRVVLKGNFN